MKRRLDKLIGKFFFKSDDALPVFLLHTIFHSGKYLPFTSSALKMRFLACICNDIVVNDRKNYLEFGCGLSTVIIARLIKHNNLTTNILSIEEDLGWITYIKAILEDEGLDNIVTLVHAPTCKSENLTNSFEYKGSALEEALELRANFDVVLIDGPAAWEPNKINSRISTHKLIKHKLAQQVTVFIDNANRVGEKKLISFLSKDLAVKPIILDRTFAIFTVGAHYNFII